MTGFRRTENRLYARRGGRWYGDFRDFTNVGGGREALIAQGEKRATTDETVAKVLAVRRVEQLELLRRNRALKGFEQSAGNFNWKGRPILDEGLLRFAHKHYGLTRPEYATVREGKRLLKDIPHIGDYWNQISYGDVILHLTGYKVVSTDKAGYLLERRGCVHDIYTLEPAIRIHSHSYYWLREVILLTRDQRVCRICGIKYRQWDYKWGYRLSEYFCRLFHSLPGKDWPKGFERPFDICCSERCGVEYFRDVIHTRREQQWFRTEGKALLRQVKKVARRERKNRKASQSRKKVSPHQKTSAT